MFPRAFGTRLAQNRNLMWRTLKEENRTREKERDARVPEKAERAGRNIGWMNLRISSPMVAGDRLGGDKVGGCLDFLRLKTTNKRDSYLIPDSLSVAAAKLQEVNR